MGLRWYVIRTKPNSENLASSSIKREGMEFFCPRVKTFGTRIRKTTEALFPGYLFLRFDSDTQDGQLIHRLPGVLGWVRFNGIIPAVPDETIASLAQQIDKINEKEQLWNKFNRDDTVRVIAGEMNTLGTILELPKSQRARVWVLMEFMGRQVPTQVPWQNLRPNQDSEPLESGRRGYRRTRGRGRWIRGFASPAITQA